MVISTSVLSFYGDRYYFSYHVVDILQAFGLAVITVVDASSTPFFHFGYVVVNFLSQVNFIFLLFQLHQHTLTYPKTKEKEKLTEIKIKYNRYFLSVNYFPISLGSPII